MARKKKLPKVPRAYYRAEEVAAIGRKLINEHHSHLSTKRVDFVFVNEIIKTKGRELGGRARVVSGLNAWSAGEHDNGQPVPFFLIEISRPFWYRLSEKQRTALVDHELCHCETDDKGKPKTVPHDLEEFTAVIHRHGLWRDEVLLFASVAARQKELFDIQEKPTPNLIKEVAKEAADQINSGALNQPGMTVTALVQ